MRRKFKYEFECNEDNDDRCILRSTEEAYGYCHEIRIKCRGKFEDRPANCPLVEVKDEEI
jgi:hypothetical protein